MADNPSPELFCRNLLEMVACLHQQGYQRLRARPSMAPSGLYWRLTVNAAHSRLEPARYTSGDGSVCFGWADAAGDSPSELARKFLLRLPELADAGHGPDAAYAAWYDAVLKCCDPGVFITAHDGEMPLNGLLGIVNGAWCELPLSPEPPVARGCAKPVPVPWPRSYWVEPGRLLAACFPGDADPLVRRGKLEGLLDHGITCIINLMHADETGHDGQPFTPYAREFAQLAAKRGLVGRCLRLPVRDMSVPSREQMAAILDAVDLAYDARRGVLVHCWGGRGRTGTVVGCWLARHGHVSGDAALARIDWLRRLDPTRRKPSPETHEQREFVRRWGVGY